MGKKSLFLSWIVFLFLQTNKLIAQEFLWNSGIHTFFDNREYFNKYIQPQSMLGVRGFGDIGFAVDENNQFSAGANLLYEFGSTFNKQNILPILYFKHKSKHAQVNMGAFPRRNLVKLPSVLQTDTFNYYRPNVEGIYLDFSNSLGHQNVWLDWTSRQTDVDRETFLIGATGEIRPGIWFLKYDFIMYHYAGTAIPDTNDHIRDNGGLVFIGGLNLSDKLILDSLTISSGITMSYDRLRNVYDTDFRYGNITELFASYKGVGLRSTTYFGEGQTQMVGDGMYSANFYSRLDLFLNLFRKSKVKSQVEFSFHFLPEVVDVSQRFVIYLELGGKSRPLNKGYLFN